MSEGPFICSRLPSLPLTLCTPKEKGDRLYALVPKRDETAGEDPLTGLKRHFRSSGEAKLVATPPLNLPVFEDGTQVFDITPLLPSFIQKKVGRSEDTPGPNCWQTVLASLGYKGVAGRAVGKMEFEYYLTRDFLVSGSGCEERFGSVIVYGPLVLNRSYDAGSHAALVLGGDLVFHKGAWGTEFPYEIVPREEAMARIQARRSVPLLNCPVGYTLSPMDSPDEQVCYVRKDPPSFPSVTIKIPETEKNHWIALFRYYTDRFKEIPEDTSLFHETRVDLLTIENGRHIEREFEQKYGAGIGMLHGMDRDLAEVFLAFRSVSANYGALADLLDPLFPEWATKNEKADHYRNHYVHFNQQFDDELDLHLERRGVPKKDWPAINRLMRERIERYDPGKFAASHGESGIPYFKLLKAALQDLANH